MAKSLGKIPERVFNIWLCGFLENNTCLHVGTPAIVSLFLLQTDPAPIREGTSAVALTGNSLGTPGLDALVFFPASLRFSNRRRLVRHVQDPVCFHSEKQHKVAPGARAE